jgi:2-polyprenyl-3-methyl-5-hydroxy-6-metoxy-1,4-benzoquinol methylase
MSSANADYRRAYDAYWSSEDRIGESSGDLARIADQVVDSCGLGPVLDVGAGEGSLVSALLERGIDAHGVDVSAIVVARANRRIPGRFSEGSLLALPFGDSAFQTVVSTDCLEHLAPEDVPAALREIWRVADRYVFLRVATTRDRDAHWHLTVEGRQWWESRCFEAGFRKHPAYYKLNDYASLNQDGWQISILLEKIPAGALAAYPLASLQAERGLHMDMLRETGERSDAHVIRYHWASGYIKPGDRVLDAACGLGYGGHVIRNLTRVAQVVRIDNSEFAIDYAARSYGDISADVQYSQGTLPEALSAFETASFDAICCFETLEHVENPASLLREFHRLLTPGGRVVVSVPNDWSDATGEDPNPYHLHVYDWTRLKREVTANFVLEDAFAETASQCKLASQKHTWVRRERSLHRFSVTEPPGECEWLLLAAMKSPLSEEQPYRERVMDNIAATGHPSASYNAYRYPWLMHALVNANTRLKTGNALEELASAVLAVSSPETYDYAAALCVLAYRILELPVVDRDALSDIVSRIDPIVAGVPREPLGLRWKVSLLFVKANLLQAVGQLEQAQLTFKECASEDVRPFGIHLATKTTVAWFLAGRLAYALGDETEAKSCWERGVETGTLLLSVSVDDILIDRSFPNLFNHGDGAREYTLAWDSLARSANGLHLLRKRTRVDDAALSASFQTERAIVTRDLLDCRSHLRDRSRELVDTRQALVEQSASFERSAADLTGRTSELIDVRQTLVERTRLLEQSNAELLDRTRELVEVRQLVVERTALLEQSNAELLDRTRELVEVRQLLVERTAELEQSNAQLATRTRELEVTRLLIAKDTTPQG